MSMSPSVQQFLPFLTLPLNAQKHHFMHTYEGRSKEGGKEEQWFIMLWGTVSYLRLSVGNGISALRGKNENPMLLEETSHPVRGSSSPEDNGMKRLAHSWWLSLEKRTSFAEHNDFYSISSCWGQLSARRAGQSAHRPACWGGRVHVL